ncbi:ATP-binding protein [Candidatus Gracilibacteria bacterium]|nr:ATP-binding protein [Candidatus Gracilibacteria bacterium]
MTQKSSGFDAFFKSVTDTPEFQNVLQKGWEGNFGKALREMEESVAKAGDITKAFQTTFATPDAIETGMNTARMPASPTKDLSLTLSSKEREQETKNAGDDETRKLTVEPEYFEMKNPATWGFKGVAGMEKLKQELTDGFIRPLQFLFLVRDLKEKYENLDKNSVGNEYFHSENNQNDNNRSLPKSEQEKKERMLVELYKSYEKFQVGIPTGMLFYGPPGTGKTFMTKKLAQELGAGMITKSVGEFGSSYLHETSKNIREFFAGAKRASESGPIILFLDEIDSLVSKRDNKVDANKAEEVSQFLQEFNALEDAPNLIVIAATNRPDHLDSAILRSGRLDKKYYIGPPDFDARAELFEIFIERQGRPHGELNYKKLAEFTDGYVASDIEAIVEEASRDASGNILDIAQKIQNFQGDVSELSAGMEKHQITQALLELAIADTVSSLKMVDMSVFEKWEEGLK